MMTLFEIDNEIAKALENAIDIETGELIHPELIENLQLARNDKIKNIALAYKNKKAEMEAIKGQKDLFVAREKRAKKEVEDLGKYLEYALQGETFKCAEVEVKYRKSTSVQVSNDVVLPEEYLTIKTTLEPNKKLLADALKNGTEIAGVELVTKNNIQIK